SGPSPRCSTGSSAPPHRRSRRRRRNRTSSCGTGSTSSCCCRRWRWGPAWSSSPPAVPSPAPSPPAGGPRPRPPPPPPAPARAGALRGGDGIPAGVTPVAQPGSLPIYAGVILLTAAVVPGALLLGGHWWPGWPPLVEVPAHVPIAALLVTLAIAAAAVRRRF